LKNLVFMKNLVILLPILLVLFSNCTSRFLVIYKNPEEVAVNPGERVRVRTKDNKRKTFKVLEVQPDKIVGETLEFHYTEINTMEIQGLSSSRFIFLDSLEELKNKKVRVRTKDQKLAKFKIIQVEDSVLKGENQTIGLSDIESIYVIESKPGNTVGLVLGFSIMGGDYHYYFYCYWPRETYVVILQLNTVMQWDINLKIGF